MTVTNHVPTGWEIPIFILEGYTCMTGALFP